MDNSNNQSQYRFMIAAVLSLIVLFGWGYFFNPSKPAGNSNTAQVANSNSAATPSPAATVQPQAPVTASTSPDLTPNRTITIKTSLYEVTLDSRGAVASSWILLKNKSPKGEYPVYADGSNGAEKKPLQLISPRTLEQTPRELPFRLVTGDENLNALLNDRNYQISVPEETLTLADGDEKRIEFVLTGDGGLAVKKTFVFRGDSYVADLAVDAKQNGQPIQNTKLAIGASVGDHAIKHHDLYHTEPEAVAAVDGNIKRHQAGYAFTYDASNQASLVDTGTIDWVATGDSYFAMAAIPPAPVQSIEYKASKYDIAIEPYFRTIFQWITRSPETKETRHLVTAYMPVATDGSVTKIYTGTKDYFLLNGLSASLTDQVGREVSIVNLINFSNYSWIRPITSRLAVPILYALHFFNGITANYGVAIILFTFLFYSLLFPLRWSQSKSFKKAAGNAPKMKAIQDQI
ncbi:MAG: membrane protein insertase YidC, partial [Acidobacteriota bacterium]